jgi:hypothetical protein
MRAVEANPSPPPDGVDGRIINRLKGKREEDEE